MCATAAALSLSSVCYSWSEVAAAVDFGSTLWHTMEGEGERKGGGRGKVGWRWTMDQTDAAVGRSRSVGGEERRGRQKGMKHATMKLPLPIPSKPGKGRRKETDLGQHAKG